VFVCLGTSKLAEESDAVSGVGLSNPPCARVCATGPAACDISLRLCMLPRPSDQLRAPLVACRFRSALIGWVRRCVQDCAVDQKAMPTSDSMKQVSAKLQEIGLEMYVDQFEKEGFDDLSLLVDADKDQLEVMAKSVDMKPGHKMKLLKLAKPDGIAMGAMVQPAVAQPSTVPPPQPLTIPPPQPPPTQVPQQVPNINIVNQNTNSNTNTNTNKHGYKGCPCCPCCLGCQVCMFSCLMDTCCDCCPCGCCGEPHFSSSPATLLFAARLGRTRGPHGSRNASAPSLTHCERTHSGRLEALCPWVLCSRCCWQSRCWQHFWRTARRHYCALMPTRQSPPLLRKLR
jgi:hypothetical protein